MFLFKLNLQKLISQYHLSVSLVLYQLAWYKKWVTFFHVIMRDIISKYLKYSCFCAIQYLEEIVDYPRFGRPTNFVVARRPLSNEIFSVPENAFFCSLMAFCPFLTENDIRFLVFRSLLKNIGFLSERCDCSCPTKSSNREQILLETIEITEKFLFYDGFGP